jgi:probable rRNA maturation factor
MPTTRRASAKPGPEAVHLKLDLALQFGRFSGATVHRAVLRKAKVAAWIESALKHPAEIAVRIVGEDEARMLNLQYRQRDYATNVLTFDYAREPWVSADLVLCGPVVEREAREQHKTLEEHYAHLLVHGTLHAQGYDHETNERDALEMEALEVLLLGSLGFGNPY